MALILIVTADNEIADRMTGWLGYEHVVCRLPRLPGNGDINADIVVYVTGEQAEKESARPRPEDFRRPGGPGLIITGRMHDAPRWAAQAATGSGPVRAVFPLAPVALQVAIRSALR